MKIVQINAVCGISSTGRTSLELSRYLNTQNIENYIIYANGYSDYENAIRMNSDFDIKVHSLLSRITGKQGYFSKEHTKKIISKLELIKPDIVHLRNLHGNYIHLNMLLQYLAENDIPTVITLHDCWFFTGKCVYYSIAQCYRWQNGCGHCPQLNKGNKSWFFDRTKKMWKDKKEHFRAISRLGVIGVSDWITNEAKKSFLKNAKIIKRIYNWIDLDVFYPHASEIKQKLGIKAKYVILGVADSWSNDKGLSDFNTLAEMLNDDYKIVLVGRKIIPINDKILHINRTNDVNMLSDIYAMADVFFNPTKRETFGKVTAEALACGTPVVAYNTTACPELVGENCGYIEELGDIKSAYKDIVYITANSEIDKMRETCRQFSVDNFNKDIILKDMVKVYYDLLNG